MKKHGVQGGGGIGSYTFLFLHLFSLPIWKIECKGIYKSDFAHRDGLAAVGWFLLFMAVAVMLLLRDIANACVSCTGCMRGCAVMGAGERQRLDTYQG